MVNAMKQKLVAFIFLLSITLCLFACTAEPAQYNEPLLQPDQEMSGEPVPDESLENDEVSQEVPVVTEKRVSFFATGDNLIHTGIWRQANRNAGGSGNACMMNSEYDFAPFYQSLAPMISSADISFLNQETLVAADESGEPKNYPAFNTPRACGDTMVELGFDVVNLANNHMLDMGSSGLKNSIEYWREQSGVVQVGGYLNEADYNTVRVVERDGVKIAFLAYVEDANNSGRGMKTPLSSYHNYSSLGLYVPAMNEAELTRQVESARKLADFVVVAFHWGVENSSTVSSVQESFVSLCAELGVDVVLGSHPHVLQPMKWVAGKTSSGKTLVVYSLGNMISLMESTPSNLLGGALTLDFVKQGDLAFVENVVLTPIVTHCNTSYREIHVYLLEDYTEDLYRRHYIHSHCNTQLSDFAAIVQREIPQEFLRVAENETEE